MNKHNQLPVIETISKFAVYGETVTVTCTYCKHKNYIKSNRDFKPPYHQVELCWYCRRVSFDIQFVSVG